MNILIAGCGKVGKTIAKELANENHEIYVLDHNESVVRELSNTIDCMGLIGDAASMSDLKEIGVANCDLLCAMSSSDEINMLSCLFARKINPKIKTIARVRNPLYANDINYIKDELGLTMAVNPEDITAREVAKILRLPEALKVETFSKSRVQMVTISLNDDNPLVNKKIMDVSKEFYGKVLIIGVERGDGVIIPSGQTELKADDRITIIAAPYNIASFLERIRIVKKPVKRVIIAGGSSIAYYLSKTLVKSGVEVTIIEVDKKKCEQLVEQLPDVNVVCGDATDGSLLEEEGLSSYDGFVSLTGVDEVNVMLSLFAGASSDAKVVTKINHISFNGVVDNLNIGSIISPRSIMADQIIKYVRGFSNAFTSANITTLYRILNNRAEVLTFKIKKESKITGKHLKDLDIKENTLIGAIIRDDKVIIPSGNDTIEPNDMVLVATSNLGLDDIEGILK